MSESIKYPTWEDVGIPYSLWLITDKADRRLTSFLVEMRIFHQEIKSGVQYTCGMCGYRKSFDKPYEEFSDCQKCNSQVIRASLYWRTSKNQYKPIYNEDSISHNIVQHMLANHLAYFKKPPEAAKDFVKMEYLPRGYSVQFAGSKEVVISTCPVLATMKAALACPYIWDGSFDWQLKEFSKIGNMRFTHLLNQWLADNNDKPN